MSEGYLSQTLMHKFRNNSSKRELINNLIHEKQLIHSRRVEFSLEYQKLDDVFQVKSTSKVFNNIYDFKKNSKRNVFITRKMFQKHSKITSFLQILPKNQHIYRFSMIPSHKSNSQTDISVRKQTLMDSSTLTNFSFLQKIEKRKKSKNEKCKIVKNFGLNIKTMQINSDIGREMKKKKKYQYKNVTVQAQNLQVHQQKKRNLEVKSINKNELAKKTLLRKKAASFLQTTQSKKYQKSQKNKDKIKNMIETSNQFLKTFGCLNIVQPSSENQIKYKFYVGKGNNKNLIISTFRKRVWWTETSDINIADFVWTQVKQAPILLKIEFENQDQIIKDQKSQALKLASKKDQSSENLHPQKLQVKKSFKMPQVGHNHISKGYLFGNKKTLFQNLKSYYKYKNQNLLEIIPLTFFVDQIDSQKFKQFQAQAQVQKNAIWIVKPGQNSNRGRGIFVSDSLQQIKRKIQKRKGNSKHTYIIQKYLTNIFLYQKRKFDIRTYMLLLNINGVTKFYWYKEGYIRTSSQIFDLKDLKNEFIHLTNDAIQIKNTSYGQFQGGNKLSYNQFQHYLDHNFYQKKYSIKNLHEEMKKLSIEAIKSAYHKLDSRSYALELFGLDFIIDNEFKPWLIQINTNPCLQLTSPVLQRIIPSLIQNVFRLGIDPIYQPEINASLQKHCFLYTSCLSNSKFQLLFDSLINRDFKWEEYQKNHSENNASEEQKMNNISEQII